MIDYEQKRLYMLRQLRLLDTPPSDSFDRITRMASQLFGLPIAAVSLTDSDRQWFKSRVGVEHWEIPRHKAPCGEVADTCDVLVVPDLLQSQAYLDSPLARSGIRFYAGAPLRTHDGYTLGAMCVLGLEPRTATEQEIVLLQDLAAMVMAQIELQHAFGRVDQLTGLPNRSQFMDDLQDLARSSPGQRCYAVATELVDIHHLSSLQRVMGPACLDELSLTSTQLLQQTLGVGTQIYQLGTGQYVHLTQDVDDHSALIRGQALRECLLALNLNSSLPFILRPVVGVAPFVLGEQAPADLLRLAHSAAEDARLTEKGTSMYSATLDARHQRRFTLLTEFGRALENSDQFHLVYQPRVAMTGGKCVGAEALLRWRHPALGEISPVEFIPLVENTPMARNLTDWVLQRAVSQSAVWHRQGLQLQISINIAAANLEEADFTERLLDYMARDQLPLSAIELELTESGLISNGRAATLQMNMLMDAGIRIAIDDFGTGYSSLSYVQKIPAQVVKIDRSFVQHLDQDFRSQSLVRSMITMAHDLGYSVVAEGVETWESFDFLQALGCDEVQGYLLAKPMAVEQMQPWLDNLRRNGLARPTASAQSDASGSDYSRLARQNAQPEARRPLP